MDLLKENPANSFPLTPLTFLERAAIAYGEYPSIINNTTTYTWSQTHRRCLQLASTIKSLGIGRGHVVSVLAHNVPAMYELHFAVPMTGAIIHTINTRIDARMISVFMRHSESKLLFVDQIFLSLITQAIALFPTETQPPTLVLITDNKVTPDQTLSSIVDFHYTYEDLVKDGDPDFKWVRPESEWDPMTLNYTSGTTSSPKGVVHSHRQIFIITVDSLIDWSVPKHPVYLWTLPMFHSNGWSFTWGMAAVGGTNICFRKFDVALVYDLIFRHKVTHMCGAPVLLNMLSNSPLARPLKKPVHFLTGGAPPPAAVLVRVEALGFVVSHGYGLTEVAGVVVSCAWKPNWDRLPGAERAKLKARQGVRTITMAEADVIDAKSGISVERDGITVGEIVLRGGSVMMGYLKDPDGTTGCIRSDGWLYTGDVGVVHPDGYLEIRDRSKDVIVTGGENVCSVEVESILYENPAVNEAAVVARPDEFWGETVCAFVSAKADVKERPTGEEIVEFCRRRLPHYMVPKTVVFMEELPRNLTGKIEKFKLRDVANSMGSLPPRPI
ncbi:AMP-dependent synthetase and ligase family protein [Actinidia rufa]|uniref:AMP-dependent synthetase and ligase family protein n=1 Tax=Actinidia rufa TaxID=165716 RepID=A0A7J0DBW5_9ERIC|nr:AMP-dependent synthetase and ligase family protein [Actinidia rufa]